jgi:hypothetical protein
MPNRPNTRPEAGFDSFGTLSGTFSSSSQGPFTIRWVSDKISLQYFWFLNFIQNLAWAWQTSCDVAEDTYEGVRERAEDLGQGIRQKSGQVREKAGDYADRAGEAAGRAKEKVWK